jgi:phosphotriesterase-related protein
MPVELQNITEVQLEDRMYREVTEGIDGTGIKAGIIKIAADRQELSDWDKMIFRTAARVQKSTKVPIATHAWIGAVPQFELLVEHGADPNHINLAHMESVFGWRGKTREAIAEELLQIVKGGGYLLFNNFSCEFYTPFKDMVYLMKYYCDKGFSNRIMISEDCNWTWENEKQVFEKEEKYPDARLRTYAYMMAHEVPLLLDSGFTKADINTFLVDNPRNFFTV